VIYELSLVDNEYLGSVFGLKDVVRGNQGSEITTDNAVIISTIRMGFGHYRIAMAGASAARAMGFTPYWLDLLAVPGITTDVINFNNTWYSRFSRISQQYSFCSINTSGNVSPPVSGACRSSTAS